MLQLRGAMANAINLRRQQDPGHVKGAPPFFVPSSLRIIPVFLVVMQEVTFLI
jgi:hypothetical protein